MNSPSPEKIVMLKPSLDSSLLSKLRNESCTFAPKNVILNIAEQKPTKEIPMTNKIATSKIEEKENFLTLGKEYQVLKESGDNIWIVDDRGCQWMPPKSYFTIKEQLMPTKETKTVVFDMISFPGCRMTPGKEYQVVNEPNKTYYELVNDNGEEVLWDKANFKPKEIPIPETMIFQGTHPYLTTGKEYQVKPNPNNAYYELTDDVGQFSIANKNQFTPKPNEILPLLNLTGKTAICNMKGSIYVTEGKEYQILSHKKNLVSFTNNYGIIDKASAIYFTLKEETPMLTKTVICNTDRWEYLAVNKGKEYQLTEDNSNYVFYNDKEQKMAWAKIYFDNPEFFTLKDQPKEQPMLTKEPKILICNTDSYAGITKGKEYPLTDCGNHYTWNNDLGNIVGWNKSTPFGKFFSLKDQPISEPKEIPIPETKTVIFDKATTETFTQNKEYQVIQVGDWYKITNDHGAELTFPKYMFDSNNALFSFKPEPKEQPMPIKTFTCITNIYYYLTKGKDYQVTENSTTYFITNDLGDKLGWGKSMFHPDKLLFTLKSPDLPTLFQQYLATLDNFITKTTNDKKTRTDLLKQIITEFHNQNIKSFTEFHAKYYPTPEPTPESQIPEELFTRIRQQTFNGATSAGIPIDKLREFDKNSIKPILMSTHQNLILFPSNKDGKTRYLYYHNAQSIGNTNDVTILSKKDSNVVAYITTYSDENGIQIYQA